MRENLPPVELFLGKTIPQFPEHEIIEHISSGSNGHVFRAYRESTNSNLAFKVIPVNNLSPKHLDEAKKANSLENSAVVRCHDVVEYPDPKVRCVVFICDYVKGKNLEDYIRQDRANITLPFIEEFLLTMFRLLHELKRREDQHGDLHAGNVLVAKSDFDMDGRTTFRVTDFGVRELTGQAPHATDYLYVAEILKNLLECVDYRECSARDRYIHDALCHDFLKRHLIETNPIADSFAYNPRAMADKLRSLEEEHRTRAGGIATAKLLTPFDYPNCEQIGDSHLLLNNLYSDRLLGLSKIQARSNLMLTGPRGCGKTTVFRALSLDYLTANDKDNPNELGYIGIYYRCDDLYFSFPRYRTPERQEALDVPMHFLVVTLLAITLEQIGTWAKRRFPDELERKEEALVAELWDLFEWSRPDNPSAEQWAALVNRLKKERNRAAKKQRFVHVPTERIEGYFGPGVMVEACRLIRNKFSFLRDRPFYFFIDDYSDPKITKDLQINLNRLVIHRSSDVFFKVSTESPISFAREDIDGKRFVESRECDLLNLGLRYIKDDTNQTLGFLEDLFKRRFHEVKDYPVKTLKELLGSIPRNENATARAFREKKGKENYAGSETIAAMCSGDIHYMIRLVARMVDDYGGKPALEASNAVPRIPPGQQHNSIRAAAGAFMESVRTLPRWGPRLTEVVAAFGNVAYSYLLYETSTNEESKPPHQASRIEPYNTLHLSEEAQKILDDLLRYSILIEDPRGKSLREKVVPRFYLRRYLIPHFRLTFSRRDSLQLENHQIETLLCEPSKFEKSMRLNSEDDAARRRRRDPNQEDLFPDE